MAEILLYGVIGDPTDKLDAKSVTTAIRGSTGPLSVRINSPGGYVMEGLAIIEALRSYPDEVTIYVDGLAASMASAIAMVGARIICAESALIMIHKPWDASIGNADELRADAAKLDKIEQQMVEIYAKQTGLGADRLAAMLAVETWLDATEALALGFVTEISQSLKLAAMANLTPYGFRRAPDRLKETQTMPGADNETITAERDRVASIMTLCDRHKLPAEMAASMIKDGTKLETARAAILEHLAERDDRARIGHQFAYGDQTFDNPDFLGKSIGDALYARLTGKAPEGAAAEYASASMVDMARAMIAPRVGGAAFRMRAEDVLNSAAWRDRTKASSHGFMGSSAITINTGDFPDLLTATGQRFLMDMYKAAESPLKQIGRPRSATDFRSISGVQLSNFGVLDTVPENGEIKHGTFSTRKETYKLDTFAKQFGLSRQAIINDDLGAFGDVLTIMARSAAETEAQLLAALINTNPAMGDGLPLFDAGHGNLGSAAAPSVDSLDAGRKAMRTQKDLDGITPVSAAPKFILSTPGEETAIEKLILTPNNPDQVSDANPFAGKLVPLVDPRLLGTAWYLFADPALAPVLEYANLSGTNGPTVESQDGWNVLGMSFRVYEDFGAGFIDWRGAYKFPATS